MNREDVELSPWRYEGETFCRELKLYRKFHNSDKYKFTMRISKDARQYILEVYDYGNDSREVFLCDSLVDLLNKAEEEIDKIIDAMYDER